MFDPQTLVALGIVGTAVLLLVRRCIAWLQTSQHSGCGGCSANCHSPNAGFAGQVIELPLVSLETKHAPVGGESGNKS
ncbi:MAG: hypothetical protein AB8B50_04630 [Pirellulaceae bacterium]